MKRILQISPDVLWRFEPEVEEGTLFIFIAGKRRLLTGNTWTYEVLRHVDGHKTAGEIAGIMADRFPHLEGAALQNGVLGILSSLTGSGVLEPVGAGQNG